MCGGMATGFARLCYNPPVRLFGQAPDFLGRSHFLGKAGAGTLMMKYPAIDADVYFCGLQCLRKWLDRHRRDGGGGVIKLLDRI